MIAVPVDVFSIIWDSPEQLGPVAAQALRRRCAGPWQVLSAAPQLHEESAAAVDLTIVHGFQSRRLGAAIPDEAVLRHRSARPDRVLAFAGVDPASPDALARIPSLASAGLCGVSVAPAAQGVAPGDPRMLDLCEACRHHRLPLYVWSALWLGGGPMDLARPSHWDPVASRFPDLTIVIGQLGGGPWHAEAAALCARHPRVYADLGEYADRPWDLYQAVLAFVERRCPDRLLIASSFPLHTAGQVISALRQIDHVTRGTALPRVERRAIDAIVRRDALALLGIAPPVGVSRSLAAG